MEKEYILAIDLGTYCDHVLMDNAILELGKKYQIVYLTDKTHNLPENYIKESFETPSFFLNDPKIELANTRKNFSIFAIKNINKLLISYKWSNFIKKKIHELLNKYTFKSICILYPALGLLWLFDKVNIPIYIFYYAPGILCKNIPWLFNSILKTRDYKLYNKSLYEYNSNSTLKYLKRISILSKRKETIHQVLQSVNHIICWDKNTLPNILPYYKDINILYAGSLINLESLNKKNWIVNDKITNFIKKYNKIIFISFGSYGTSNLLKNILKLLLNYLNDYCIKNNYGVIYHNGGDINNTDNLLIINGFIQYEYIVPKSKLVIFTGSVCLQNICIYNCIPMLFLPLLNEQFYWAKNYQYYTNRNYIDYRSNSIKVNLDYFIIKNKKIINYLEKISNNMKKDIPANKKILQLISLQ